MHRVPDEILINTALLRRFQEEAELEGGDGRHFAMIHRKDGSFLAHNPIGPELDGSQQVFAETMLNRLNRELHHDGAWAIVFTHPRPDDGSGDHVLLMTTWQYGRFVFLWIDQDGDVAFPFEWSQGEGDEFDFADVLLSGVESWMDRCEQAWQTWQLLMLEVIDPAEGQRYRRAMGETPASCKPH